MPRIFTNTAKEPVRPVAGNPPSASCVITYQQYAAQRVSQPVDFNTIQTLTDSFKKRISDPIAALNPDIEMGQYFVIPVAEITEMLNSCQGVEFIHVCNALRDTKNMSGENKTFPVTIVVPIVKTKNDDGNDVYAVCSEENSTYLEAYPCPPDPDCPKNEMIGVILKSTTKLNDFKSLF